MNGTSDGIPRVQSPQYLFILPCRATPLGNSEEGGRKPVKMKNALIGRFPEWHHGRRRLRLEKDGLREMNGKSTEEEND